MFAVLDAFAGPRESLRLTNIAERTGLPLPTALRLVRELVAWGGLERFRDGTYRLGHRMWALGSAAPCTRRLRESVRPILHRLADRARADAYVAILDDGRATVLELRAATPAGDRLHPGGGLPLHATAAGKVLLVLEPAPPSPLAGPLARFTPYTLVTGPALAADLDRVRARGVALEKEEHRMGTVAVAAPLDLPGTDRRAAVALSGPSHIGQSRLLAALAAVVGAPAPIGTCRQG
ncbi:MAG TPA: IclR family transcriptional regulator [Spirillospora sp.]|nr:IclR family transcriptional regulator [Spirillospora sp.]